LIEPPQPTVIAVHELTTFLPRISKSKFIGEMKSGLLNREKPAEVAHIRKKIRDLGMVAAPEVGKNSVSVDCRFIHPEEKPEYEGFESSVFKANKAEYSL